jgi:hypothetical protein
VTLEEVSQVMAIVRTLWPHSAMGPDPEAAVVTWRTMLADATVAEVADALHKLAADGREHAPPVGVIAHAVALGRQSGPIGFDDIDVTKWLPTRVLLHGGIYSPDGHYSTETAAKAIAVMSVNGCHEAVLRFVAERGLRAVLTMPHGDRYALDPNQMADRRDLARHYRDVSVPGWMRDPRPGLALERACRAIDADPAVVLGAARELCARLEPVTVRHALPPADPEDGPTIDPKALMNQWKADRAKAQARRDAEAAERRAVESEAQRAALAELAEHNRTDSKS